MNIFLLSPQGKSPFHKPPGAMKAGVRFLLLLASCVGALHSQAQQAKSAVQLGDQYFAAGEYYTAGDLYGQYLNPPRNQKGPTGFPLNLKGKRSSGINKGISRADVLFKQAESYRLAHYWKAAAAPYKECTGKYASQYPEAFYWYAVCERSLGQYAVAEESLRQYLVNTGSSGRYREAAEKELLTLQYIHQQMARPDSVLVRSRKLTAPNSSESGVFAPVHVSGDEFMVSSTKKDSLPTNGINPYRSHLFYATITNGNLEGMTPAAIPAADRTDNQGAAALSADGSRLYFSQWKKEKGRVVSSIFYTTKQTDGWGQPTLLASINMNGYTSQQPFCSADGKFLFFSSDRPGGAGNLDIWYAPLNNDGTTGEPVNAGTGINTNGNEQAPFYHNSSSTLVFSSDGRPGMGGYDLFTAKGSETTWRPVENMGYPVNSQRDDVYFFAAEKAPLLSNAIFSSDRGSECCLETYSLSKAPKKRNLTGLLRDCGDNTPVSMAAITVTGESGKNWKTTTGTDGSYTVDLGNDNSQALKVSIDKELYRDTISSIRVENTDESDLLIDKLTSAALCIEKKQVPVPEPEPKLVIKAEDVVTVYFDFDRSVLRPVAVNKLDSIYNVMMENAGATIQISGYTDGLGSEEYNKKLSDRRARACADYLVKKGMDKARISFVSFGACCPIEMELINGRDNPDGRSVNRRALINVKKE